MSDDLRITQHARQRGRERLHWSPAVLERMAPRVLKDGLSLADTAGSLRRYLERQIITHRKGGNIRVWSHHVFVFERDVLITVMPLPAEQRANADKITAKKGGRS